MDSKLLNTYQDNPKPVYNKRAGILFNGPKNYYPLIIENLIASSTSSGQCKSIYKSFIQGSGFENLSVRETENKLKTKTPNDLLADVCECIAKHQGVFIHVGYNAAYEKTELSVMDYNQCRLGKPDSKGIIGKIFVAPDGWDRHVKKKDVQIFDTYNPSPVVIEEQVIATEGGWNQYKGQILYFKITESEGYYAKSLLETAYLYADTEAELAHFYNGTVKRAFENLMIIRHKKFDTKTKKDQFVNNIKELGGTRSTSAKLMIEDNWDSERNEPSQFKFDFIENKTKTDKYKHFEETASNHIRKAFLNIPPQIIDHVQGKLGNTSGKDLLAAEAMYNKATANHRERIELLFSELYRSFHYEIKPDNNWEIGLYKLLMDGTISEADDTNIN